jgi:uncharacterized membrane protein YkoI
MKRYLTVIAIAVSFLTTGASLTAAAPKPSAAHSNAREKREAQEEQARLQREAKITLEQARTAALKRAPGNVESSELEREHGKLVYSFDIRNSKGTITEVQVSAITGKIVRVEHESKKQEAAEKREESRKKTGRRP